MKSWFIMNALQLHGWYTWSGWLYNCIFYSSHIESRLHKINAGVSSSHMNILFVFSVNQSSQSNIALSEYFMYTIKLSDVWGFILWFILDFPFFIRLITIQAWYVYEADSALPKTFFRASLQQQCLCGIPESEYAMCFALLTLNLK